LEPATKCPWFFGVGSALKHFEETDQWQKYRILYNDSMFFKTLENSDEIFFPLQLT
jgi:phosphoenolpyruvate carboxylase